jgi:hypothetical protein
MNPTRYLSKKKLLVFAVAVVAFFLLLQFFRPEIPSSPVDADFQAPANVKAIIKRACYDCHSNETQLLWYDQVVPGYWIVAADIKRGRSALNFSDWGHIPVSDQKGKLWEMVNQMIAGAMPLGSYTALHPAAKISGSELAVLKDYVAGMAVHEKPMDTAKINAANVQYLKWQSGKIGPDKLPEAVNGITYMPDYKNWQAISTTDRFDNGTMRVIFGNPIAVAAIKANNIHPWPNGTVFAKVAWDEIEDKDGQIKTGAFKQIEYMIKDDKKYRSTEGWGFARFKTPKMVPYGKTALFTTECVNCHRPQKEEDFVFTKPIKY